MLSRRHFLHTSFTGLAAAALGGVMGRFGGASAPKAKAIAAPVVEPGDGVLANAKVEWLQTRFDLLGRPQGEGVVLGADIPSMMDSLGALGSHPRFKDGTPLYKHASVTQYDVCPTESAVRIAQEFGPKYPAIYLDVRECWPGQGTGADFMRHYGKGGDKAVIAEDADRSRLVTWREASAFAAEMGMCLNLGADSIGKGFDAHLVWFGKVDNQMYQQSHRGTGDSPEAALTAVIEDYKARPLPGVSTDRYTRFTVIGPGATA